MARTVLTIALVITLVTNNVIALQLLPESGGGDDTEPEDENDSSPFTIVLEHTDGWRCGGSLVFLRTALTSARCARGRRAAPRALLARAAAAAGAAPGSSARRDGARRVARLVFARGEHTEGEAAGDDTEYWWVGASTDIALAELESPFGLAARARPILMATQETQCSAPAACQVARWLPTSTLRIVDATLQPDQRCAATVGHWRLFQEHVVCLTGPELCSSDWGAGVVCGGRLCGVLSASGWSRGAVSEVSTVSAASMVRTVSAECGDVHVAQSVPRWRRFLQCAHTTHACKRDGDCVNICTEQELEDMKDSEDESSLESPMSTSGSMEYSSLEVGYPTHSTLVATQPHFAFVDSESSEVESSNVNISSRRRGDENSSLLQTLVLAGWRLTRRPPAARSSAHPPPHDDVAPLDHKVAPRLEFEPNRADFKAGEYEDNTADYTSGDVGMVILDGTNGTDSTVAVQNSSCEGPTTGQLLDHFLESRMKSEELLPAVESRAAPRHQHFTHLNLPKPAPLAPRTAVELTFYISLSYFFI